MGPAINQVIRIPGDQIVIKQGIIHYTHKTIVPLDIVGELFRRKEIVSIGIRIDPFVKLGSLAARFGVVLYSAILQ